MLCRLIAALAIVVAFSNPALAIEATLPRHPAPSPDGTRIAFSWQGDLWLVPSTGGEARRITAHPADERRPVWSQDGTQLAFASDRHGSYDVFVMPVDGSAPPSRLTYASLTDVPTDFTKDGTAVLFHSRRAGGISFMVELLLVPVAGGTPSLAQDAFGQHGVYSPNGQAMAFVRGSTKWYRRGYRGPASRDLWLATGDGTYHRLTAFDGDDDSPSWIAPGELVYTSTQAGRKNLFRLDVESGQTHQLTSYNDSAVRNPRASADGRVVAYEFEDGIWTIAPEGGEPTRLTIDVPADLVVNPVQRKTETKGANQLNINHDGTLAAFTVHGDVFVTEITSKDDQEIAKPVTVQITATPEREQEPVWSPDGKSLVFSSARSGVRQLYSARPANQDRSWIESFEFHQTPLTDSESEATDPVFSPDGKRLAYTRGKGDIVVIDADGRADIPITTDILAGRRTAAGWCG
jgi:tricorn protease